MENLKRIDHVGIIVEDLDGFSRFLGEGLGLELVRSLDDPDRKLRARFYRCGDASIELIELGDPEARARRLGQGPARIEHVAFQVEGLEEAAEKFASQGVRMQSTQPQVTKGGRSFFSVPESSQGVVMQLLEPTP